MTPSQTASSKRWVPVIGLEVHCQLATQTKLFCGCAVEFGAPPNSRTCPLCSGQPGVLPVLNKEAHALAVRAALALGCDVAPRSKFDRKNYFYCDLPKGYQISQYDQPYCRGGGIRLQSGRFIRLNRIHIEEDAGKAIHDRGTRTLVDLNRAGVPLIESVTEADLESADEAYEYLTALKEIFQYTGVSECDMEKGSLR
ncbi:MAG: Asp-tRNA(Asn)/Glu-tRNA(Gln) amidotransferase GatCAB subunit B, partial [Planctomycetota bacterium]